MRILLISNYYPPFELGGLEQNTREICLRLRNGGHKTSVLTSNHRADELQLSEKDVIRGLFLESPDHIHYHPRYILTHRLGERRNKELLNQTVESFKPDIIFLVGMWNLPISLAEEAEKLSPGRVVYYVASYWPTELDAHTAYWTTNNEKNNQKYLKRILGWIAQRTLLNQKPRNCLNFPHVLCVSNYMKQHLIKHAQIPADRMKVVNNGIDLDHFQIKDLSKNDTNLKLVYAGRLSPDKGVHTAIEAIAIFNNRQRDDPAELSIYGKGSPIYEEYLRDQISQNGMQDYVHFEGWVGRDQIPDILIEYDVFLFPSIWPEPLARAVQEAMACGLVVIGTTTGGTPEILQDGYNGLTFEAGDATMLADKISEITSDREHMVALGKAARKTVEAHFGLDRMVDELEASFEDVLHASPP